MKDDGRKYTRDEVAKMLLDLVDGQGLGQVLSILAATCLVKSKTTPYPSSAKIYMGASDKLYNLVSEVSNEPDVNG